MPRELSTTNRRQFLAASSAALWTGVGLSQGFGNGSQQRGNREMETYVLKSQPLPQPKIVLPTDSLPKPEGPKKRIAAITTAYFKYSHADDIITKFIDFDPCYYSTLAW